MPRKAAVGSVSNCTRAQDRSKRLPTRVTTPGTSIDRTAPGSLVSGVAHHVIASATRPMGRLIQKIHRQSSPSTMTPPTRGPNACAPQHTAIHAAIAVSRCLPVKVTAMIARAVGRIAAAPIPSRMRPMISTNGEGARPATMEPRSTRQVPMPKSRRRPKMSPTRPPTMIRAPARKNPLTAHWRVSMDPPRSRAMVGSAMEMSLAVTQTSAVTRQSPTRDHQRRSVCGCACWVGETMGKA